MLPPCLEGPLSVTPHRRGAEESLLPHIEEIRRELAEGRATYAAISKRYQVSLEGVSLFVSKHNLPRRAVGRLAGTTPYQPSEERKQRQEECLRLAREGWSSAAIAASLNPPRTREMVRRLLQQAGYKGMWRLVAEDRASIALQIAPLVAQGMSRLQMADALKSHDIALSEIDIVLGMARSRHYENSERHHKPEHVYLDAVCAAMEQVRCALESGKSARHARASAEKKIYTQRRQLLQRAILQARKTNLTMRAIAEQAELAYSSLTAMLGGVRSVTRSAWNKLTPVLPTLAQTPYPTGPQGSEDMDEDSGFRVVEETPSKGHVQTPEKS